MFNATANNLTRQNIAGCMEPVLAIVQIIETKNMAIKIQQPLQTKYEEVKIFVTIQNDSLGQIN